MGMKREERLFLFALLVTASVGSPAGCSPTVGSGDVGITDIQLELALSVKTMDKVTRFQTPVSFRTNGSLSYI